MTKFNQPEIHLETNLEVQFKSSHSVWVKLLTDNPENIEQGQDWLKKWSKNSQLARLAKVTKIIITEEISGEP